MEMSEKKYVGVVIPLVIIFVCIIGLIILIHPSNKKVELTVQSDTVCITVQGQEFNFQVSYDNPVQELFTMTSEKPVDINISEFEGLKVKVNGVFLSSGEYKKIHIEKIAPTTFIEISFYDLNESQIGNARIATLPADFPKWTILNTSGSENGYYYLAVNSYVLKLDGAGNIVFYRNVGETVSDFRMHNVNGRIFYSFFVNAGDPVINQVVPCNNEDMSRVARMVLDENYMVYDWIEYMIPSEHVPEEQPIEESFLMIGDKHYIISAHVGKWVDNIPDTLSFGASKTRVAAVVLQEIQDGQLVFEWDSTDYTVLYEQSDIGSGFSNNESFWVDYAHLNSIEIDRYNGNLVCYLENCATIIEIDRSTGSIEKWHKVNPGIEAAVIYTKLSEDRSITTALSATSSELGIEDISSDSIIIQEYFLENGATKQYIGLPISSSEIISIQKHGINNILVVWHPTGSLGFALTEVDINLNEVQFEILSTGKVASAFYQDTNG